MPDFYNSKGVIHQTSCVATPQQNGIVEHKHQHILNVARALLFQSNIPLAYWSFLVQHAVYIINRLPSPLLQNLTPFQSLHDIPPSFSNLKVFGSLCFASTLSHDRSKFAPRARKCVFLGIPPSSKAYTVLDLANNQIFLSRDVIFHELVFPFKSDSASSSLSIPWPEPQSSSSSFLEASPPPSPPISHPSPTLRRSTCPHNPPSYLREFHCALTHTAVPSSGKCTPTYPLSSVLSYSTLSSTYHSFVNVVSSSCDPVTYSQAVKLPIWQDAMAKEIAALEQNQTWVLTPLPAGKSTIGCKWVYRTKYKANGEIERHKARLVAKGYTQTEGVDYFDTFSLWQK